MSEVKITANNFEEVVLKSDKPVLVDFWASWCGPCRMLAPVIEEIANEQEGNAVVGKVNVDEEPELARRFDIMSIPTVIAFKNGKKTASSIGVTSKESLVKLIRE